MQVPRRARKRRRVGRSEAGSQYLRAQRPGEIWAYDFVMDRTSDGRRLKFLVVEDGRILDRMPTYRGEGKAFL